MTVSSLRKCLVFAGRYISQESDLQWLMNKLVNCQIHAEGLLGTYHSSYRRANHWWYGVEKRSSPLTF